MLCSIVPIFPCLLYTTIAKRALRPFYYPVTAVVKVAGLNSLVFPNGSTLHDSRPSARSFERRSPPLQHTFPLDLPLLIPNTPESALH